jgi:hypothetical protein
MPRHRAIEIVFIPGGGPLSELDRLLNEASRIKYPAERIESLSSFFLGMPYQEYTLDGSGDGPEALIINLQGVDCFTLLDYVEAMRRASTFEEFKEQLIKTRYRDGAVSFSHRNHFFTDWSENSPEHIKDVTAQVGGPRTITVNKTINKKEDGTFFLKGVRCLEREVSYIPPCLIDEQVMDQLRTGDYAGIYAEAPGLDVSHVGIVIRKSGPLLFRHASSERREVIDEDFEKYITDKPGLVVLRPQ